MTEEEILEEIQGLAQDLGGNIQKLTTSDHSGRTSKKIVIEYDIKQAK